MACFPAGHQFHEARTDGHGLLLALLFRQQGDHAEKVIFHADEIYRLHLSLVHNEFERTGKAHGLPASVQDERGFREKRGYGNCLKDKFIVQHAIIVYFSFTVRYLLRARPVGNNLEAYLRRCDNAHLNTGLGAHQTPQQPFLLCRGQSDIVINLRKDRGVQAVEVPFLRHHHKAGHVGRSGTEREMGFPLREIALRARCAAQGDQRAELSFTAIGKRIEARLRFLRQQIQAVQQTIKQFGHGLGRGGAQHKNAAVKFLIMKKLCIPNGSDETKFLRRLTRPHSPEQALRHPLQRHVAFGASLEMRMLRNRRATVGTVIENNIVIQLCRQVQHVRETVPNGLRRMDIARNDQMVGENGRPVYQNVVFAALSALERQRMLVLHVIFFAQRTAVVEDGHTARVGLERDQHTP